MTTTRNKKKRTKRAACRILYVTPEAVPFASSGGLGEVAGSLPRALHALRGDVRYDCRVMMPLYGKIPESVRRNMKFLGTRQVPVAWRSQYMGLFELKQNGVTFYFIDNEYYFRRDGLYGYYDDGERFAYFSAAVFEALELLSFQPDIIHANDWQTALVPVYQNSVYRRAFTKTVFTIHNIEYQGHYGREALNDILNLPADQQHLVEFHGDVNLMKGAIETSHRFTTVSPTYAEELKSPAFAFGLDEIIRRNSHKLTGILNGIDTRTYNPERDPLIPAHYSAGDLSGKQTCKTALQHMLHLPERDVPLVTLISRLVPTKGIDLIVSVMDELLSRQEIQFVMLGTGNGEYEQYFRQLQQRHPDQVISMIEFDTKKSHQLYAAGDILLMPSRSEPCGLSQMIGCRYGNVPVVRETGGLKDSITDCTLGDGNGFLFRDYNTDGFYHAVMNAIRRWHDRENWSSLVRHDLKENFSWNRSAHQYADMYLALQHEES